MEDVRLENLRTQIKVLENAEERDPGTERLIKALKREEECLACPKTCCRDNPKSYRHQYDRHGQRGVFMWCLNCSTTTGEPTKFLVTDSGGLVCEFCGNKRPPEEDQEE